MFFRGDQYRYKISPDQVKDRVTAMEDYLQSIPETPPAGIGLLLISKLKIPTFHWPFIQRKQSMFTFALAFCSGYWYFSLHFQALCTLCRKRKKEFGRKNWQWKQLTTAITSVRHRVSYWSLCSIFFCLFQQKMHFKVLRKTYEL